MNWTVHSYEDLLIAHMQYVVSIGIDGIELEEPCWGSAKKPQSNDFFRRSRGVIPRPVIFGANQPANSIANIEIGGFDYITMDNEGVFDYVATQPQGEPGGNVPDSNVAGSYNAWVSYMPHTRIVSGVFVSSKDGHNPSVVGNIRLAVINGWSFKAWPLLSFTASELAEVKLVMGNVLSNPTFSPAAGTYTSAQSVSLISAEGAVIRYTTNGSDPAESSSVYSAPIVVSANTTIKAKAWKTGMTASNIAAAAYTITPAPVITVTSPNGGENLTAGAQQTVTWTSAGTVGNVNIDISTNSGITWNTLAANTPNDGSQAVTLPNTPSALCRIRVQEPDGSPADASNSNFTITAKTASTALGFKRGAIHNWSDLSKLNSDIDMAAYYGEDSFSPGLTPAYIAGVKNGDPDYIGNGINYAHTKGIKTYLFMNMNKYTGGDREAFKNSAAAQAQFLSDLAWILEKYPTLDGIEMEEPHAGGIPVDGGAAWRTFNNDFFTRCKDVVSRYKPLDRPDLFVWSFNCASNSASSVWGLGIDTAYINANKLFNAYEIQNVGGQSLGGFQSAITAWEARLPDLEVFSCIYLTWSSLVNACKDQYPAWDSPTCWNQAFFDQLKWADSAGHSVRIFVHSRLGQPASRWPDDATPGATAGEKVKYIWDTGVPAPVITVTAPNGGESLTGNTSQTVTWTSEGTVGNVNIDISTNSGTTWKILVSNTVNDGSQAVIIPNTPSAACKIRVQEPDGLPTDASDSNFAIAAASMVSPPAFSPPAGTYTSAQNISLASLTAGVTIRYTTDGSDPTESSLKYSTPIPVSVTATIKAKAWKTGMTASGIVTAAYTISPDDILDPANRISNPGFESGTLSWTYYAGGGGAFAASSPGHTGTNACKCTITAANANIQLYQTGIVLEPDTRYRLTFSAYSTTGNDVTVHLLQHGSPYADYGLNYTANLGTAWQAFTTEFNTTGFTSRVSDGRFRFWLAPFASAGDAYYIDDVRLEIVVAAPAITVTSPNGGENLAAGAQQAVTWTSVGTVGNVNIDISTNSGTTWKTLVSNTPNDGSQAVTIPNTPSATCRIRVQEPDGLPSDASNSNFTITTISGYKISGAVQAYKSGLGVSGLSGVTLALSGKASGVYITKEDGNYEFAGLAGGDYNITPVKSNWRFWPRVMRYTGLRGDKAGQNFIGMALNVRATVSPPAPASLAVTPLSEASSESSAISVLVPEGAFTTTTDVIMTAIEAPASDKPAIRVVGYGVSIVSDKNQQPVKNLTITMTYDKISVSGYKEEKLVVGRYDELNQRWIALPTTRYPGENKVVGVSDHLSRFALLELLSADDLGAVKAYPNPYNPAKHPQGMKLEGLTAGAMVKIYTVVGGLIRELKETGNQGSVVWDGKNESGRIVASGVYIAHIKGAAGVKKIKLAVEK